MEEFIRGKTKNATLKAADQKKKTQLEAKRKTGKA